MTGRLERLDEIDYGSLRVVATISAQLIEVRSGRTVWTGDASETLDVEPHTVNGVVTTMSQAVQKTIERLLADLNRQLTAT